eukprot:7670375-Alexandrium_andersonii.AAC.1
MSASLVGSEMCIRDRSGGLCLTTQTSPAFLLGRFGASPGGRGCRALRLCSYGAMTSVRRFRLQGRRPLRMLPRQPETVADGLEAGPVGQ